MKNTWEKLRKIFQDKYPQILETLNPGADLIDIEELEQKIGVRLPDSFKEFYQIHNGQKRTSLSLFDGDYLMSIDEIFNEWVLWKEIISKIESDILHVYDDKLISEPDFGIRNKWWNIAWIPITSDGCGDNFCIDLDPTESGNAGQIIRMIHDHPRRELIAKSFDDWINQYISDLEADKYYFSDSIGWGGLLMKSD